MSDTSLVRSEQILASARSVKPKKHKEQFGKYKAGERSWCNHITKKATKLDYEQELPRKPRYRLTLKDRYKYCRSSH